MLLFLKKDASDIFFEAVSSRKKLVATAKRPERIYKRTAEPSVTFCGEDKQWSLF